MNVEIACVSRNVFVFVLIFVYAPGPSNGSPIVDEKRRRGQSCNTFLQQGTRTTQPQLHIGIICKKKLMKNALPVSGCISIFYPYIGDTKDLLSSRVTTEAGGWFLSNNLS